MNETRRKFTASEKVSILRRHLLDKTPVSEICEAEGIQPTVFYRWQKELFENAAVVFEKTPGRKSNNHREQERIEALEAKLRRKDEVLSELMEDHIALKKSLGEI